MAAASFNDKTPPPFNAKLDVYSKWKKRFTLWQSITDVEAKKQGGLLVLRLDEDTQERVLELVTTDDIKTDGGAKKIIDQLDILFKVDDSLRGRPHYKLY